MAKTFPVKFEIICIWRWNKINFKQYKTEIWRFNLTCFPFSSMTNAPVTAAPTNAPTTTTTPRPHHQTTHSNNHPTMAPATSKYLQRKRQFMCPRRVIGSFYFLGIIERLCVGRIVIPVEDNFISHCPRSLCIHSLAVVRQFFSDNEQKCSLFLLSISCLLVITFFTSLFDKATTPSIKTTHHIGSTNRFDCNGKVSGFYADPNSCTQYFICAGVQSFEVSCASGLMFNDATKYCDWPYNVQCNIQQHGLQTTHAPVYTNPPPTTHAHGTQHPTTTTTQAPATQAPYNPNIGKQEPKQTSTKI